MEHTPSTEQALAMMKIRQGYSLVINGEAGTGKSALIKQIAKTKNRKVIVTAVTGMAARKIGGTTISSFLKLGLYRHSDELIQWNNREYLDVEILIIDEYFTLSIDQLRQVDLALRTAKKRKHEPFGGVQIILVGDNGQLEPYEGLPITPEAEIVSGFTWMQFTTVFRQEDIADVAMLRKIRNYGISQSVIADLRTKTSSCEMEGVVLAAHWNEAEQINAEFLADFAGEEFLEHTASSSGKYTADLPYETIRLYVGMQVMHTHNLTYGSYEDPDYIVNGDVGIVEEICYDGGSVRVQFDHCSVWISERYFSENETSFVKEENYATGYEKRLPVIEEVGHASFFPLRPCYALTVRKAQGIGFERGNITEGVLRSNNRRLLYTALSRFEKHARSDEFFDAR